MSSKARLGSFEDLLNEKAENETIRTIALTLRKIILIDYPEAVEVVRLGDGAACYGVGPKKMSEAHVYIMPKTKYVNLGFFHGSNMPDPQNLLEGSGKKMRHIKIQTTQQTQKPEIKTIISEALKERKLALGLA